MTGTCWQLPFAARPGSSSPTTRGISPKAVLREFDIEVTDADQFLLDQLELAPQITPG